MKKLIGLIVFFLTASVFGAVKEWARVGQAPLILGGVTEQNLKIKLLQYKNDILKGLTAAGEKQPVAILQELVDAAPGIECALPQGTTFDYMIFKGGQVIGRPVKWIGETSLRGFLIKTTEREFFVVAGCGNIAALPLQKKEAEASPSSTIIVVEEQPAPPPLTPPASWLATWSQPRDWYWEQSYSYYGGYYGGGGYYYPHYHHHHYDIGRPPGGGTRPPGQAPSGGTRPPSNGRGPTVHTK